MSNKSKSSDFRKQVGQLLIMGFDGTEMSSRLSSLLTRFQPGDEVLRRVARTFADAVRELDLPGRYGGEEIAVVLPGTNLTGARALSEKIRKGLEELAHTPPDGTPFQVTASFGAACFPAQSNAGDLVAAADAALYEAKRTGKNRVVTATAKRKARGQATAADAPAPA